MQRVRNRIDATLTHANKNVVGVGVSGGHVRNVSLNRSMENMRTPTHTQHRRIPSLVASIYVTPSQVEVVV